MSTTYPRSTGPGLKRWVTLTSVAVVLAAVFAFSWGATVRHTALVIACVLLAAVAFQFAGNGVELRFPTLPYTRRDGARRDVSNLSWSLYGDDRAVRPHAVIRVHDAAMRACHFAGLEVDTSDGQANARRVLGDDAVNFLIDPRSRPTSTQRLTELLKVFEQLELRGTA